jgi:Predicted membrane protein
MNVDEARDLLHSHGTGKGRVFCEKLATQAGIDQSHPALQRWYAAIHDLRAGCRSDQTGYWPRAAAA